MNLKIGQEIDGKEIVKMFEDTTAKVLGVVFDDGSMIHCKENESIEKVVNHKWEK
tara:strand:+ start:282 stop:446 length:165 start_codon:yes stop_codon:yes gene_type:complete